MTEDIWAKSPPELIERFDAGTAWLMSEQGVERRQMFGYPACFVDGNMFTSLHRDRWVVRLGDGWFPALTSPEEFKADMAKLLAYGEEYGRPMNPREAGVLLLTQVSQDRDTAWRTVAPFLQGLPLPPEEVAARCVLGTPQECVETLQRFVEAGCVKFVLRPACPPAQIVSQIELYGKEILPHFT